MELERYRPRAKLVTRVHAIERPRFPVIDAHNHLAEPFGGGWDHKPLPELLDRLDQAGVSVFVDLDGAWGEDLLNTHLALKERAPERLLVFGGIDWSRWAEEGDRFPERAAQSIRAQKERGVDGLKVWKDFGLRVRDHRGNLVRVDDPRLEPIWETAAELGLPVIIHVADPPAFFDPIDETNERWEELQRHPEWAFPSPPFPPFLELLEAFANLVTRHSRTTFIGAHVGGYAENLAWVGALLDRAPNLYVDIAARIGELGRQPYTARRFFLRYADRILFGSDMGPDLEVYRIMYRFLETDDEYFNYSPGEIPLQGRWYIYGLCLPEEVLERVYYRNAERVLLNKM